MFGIWASEVVSRSPSGSTSRVRELCLYAVQLEAVEVASMCSYLLVCTHMCKFCVPCCIVTIRIIFIKNMMVLVQSIP